MIKKIEDWNYYELLDIDPDAMPDEVRKAYDRVVEAYGRDSLATYGLLSDEERTAMLERVKEAYETLSSPRRRSRYDEELFAGPDTDKTKPLARFRRTLEKVEIEEAVPPAGGLLKRLGGLFRRHSG